MLELTFLLTLIVVLFLVLYLVISSNNMYDALDNVNMEGFELQYLAACPSGYNHSYTSEGDVLCCDGQIMANKCLGDKQCILNGKGTATMPNCVDLIKQEYQEKSVTWCPSSLPQYFEDRENQTKGCTSGSLNSTLNGPKTTTQPQCRIYADFNENRAAKDSCYNVKLLDSIPCFGKNCTKDLIQPVPNAPPLIAIGFTDSMGMHRTAHPKESIANFLDVVNPTWKEKGIDLNKNINVAEVAKAFYVDKTLDQTQIQFN